ncbi:MAG: GTP-binding protein [Lachnospiraceae bacterium]|nr:GTP-binding protein [Lachnospiraceae bacterium]
MTKIDIISGFLGAGKTTLIKKLLDGAFKGEKVVLIENEFGEIGIDGGFLKDAGVEITEMNSGCICCSLVGDFGKALKEVVDRFAPDRIIIEPSGVGKLSDVIKAVQDVQDDLEGAELNSFSAVVDASKAKIYMKNFGEFFNNQVESAKTIILSRTQNVKEEKLEQVVAMLKEHNADATIITTPWDELDAALVLSAMEKKTSFENEMLEEMKHHHHEHHHYHEHGEDCTCGCHDHEHHHHDHEEHEHHHHHEDGECCCGHHHDHEEHEHHEHHHDHGEGCTCGCHDHDHEGHHHHHHADEVFTSWGKETPHKYTKEEIEAVLVKLAETNEFGTILRAKGMVDGVDGHWIYFDLVPGEYELREGQADYTGKLCVIGTDLKEEALEEAFHC